MMSHGVGGGGQTLHENETLHAHPRTPSTHFKPQSPAQTGGNTVPYLGPPGTGTARLACIRSAEAKRRRQGAPSCSCWTSAGRGDLATRAAFAQQSRPLMLRRVNCISALLLLRPSREGGVDGDGLHCVNYDTASGNLAGL